MPTVVYSSAFFIIELINTPFFMPANAGMYQHPQRGFIVKLTQTLAIALTLSSSLMFNPVQAKTVSHKIPEREHTIATVKKLASAEVARLKEIETKPELKRRAINTNWISATFFVGSAKLVDVAEVPDVLAFNLETAQRFNYAHQGHGAPVHLINADDQAIGDLYQAIYLRTGLPGVLMPLQQRLDYTLPYLSLKPAPQKLVWWWCDSLFMAPPVLTRMSAITGDAKYIDAMDQQFWRVYNRLYDKNVNLFARDERFIERRSANGKKIFWSRGQGWVVAGLARILEAMPENYPSRPQYLKLFQEMMASIARFQQPDGLWRASLLDLEAYPEPETSGTAFFTYAMAFGINHGLLDRKTYLPQVLKGWAGLNNYILPSGILGQVQSAGDQPVPTKRETTALYASGAFILAGLEIAKLNQPTSKLPLPLPKPPKPEYHPSDIPDSPLPANATAEQIREDQRRNAERQAVKDLAFDPLTDISTSEQVK